MSFDAVRKHLEGAGIEFALIGGVAVAARGAARSTLDIDVLTTDGSVLVQSLGSHLRFSLSLHAVDPLSILRSVPLRGVSKAKSEGVTPFVSKV